MYTDSTIESWVYKKLNRDWDPTYISEIIVYFPKQLHTRPRVTYHKVLHYEENFTGVPSQLQKGTFRPSGLFSFLRFPFFLIWSPLPSVTTDLTNLPWRGKWRGEWRKIPDLEISGVVSRYIPVRLATTVVGWWREKFKVTSIHKGQDKVWDLLLMAGRS